MSVLTVTVTGDWPPCPYLNPWDFFHPISPVLLRRGSESTVWWSWATCCQITTVCASGNLCEDSTVIFKEIWTVGCLRRELRDWWEKRSGKRSCKNMELFFPEDLEESIGVSYCSKSWECVNGEEKDKGAFTLPDSSRAVKVVCWSLWVMQFYQRSLFLFFFFFSSPFLWFLVSFPFWQLKSGWENFSRWLPPFLIFCSSWSKNI